MRYGGNKNKIFTSLKKISILLQFKNGKWYATEKFDTSSQCLTYDFKEENGDKVVEQTSVLTGLRRVSVDNKVKYRGRLAAPYVSEPGNMVVRFTLSKFHHIFWLIHEIIQISDV